jgi:hypothetical protein
MMYELHNLDETALRMYNSEADHDEGILISRTIWSIGALHE